MIHVFRSWRGTLAAAAIVVASAAIPISTRHAVAANVVGTTCPNFPANSWWRADISKLKVHVRSAQWMARMSPTRKLHPDFGPSFGAQPAPYGIPITVVGKTHAKVGVVFDYADESDRVGYPLGNDTKVEGGQWQDGDRHTIVVDRDTCRLYETWATRRPVAPSKVWRAGSGATWLLKSNALRTDTLTSADAAGLPILPGLLTYHEVVVRRLVDHAIRFTTNVTDRRYLWPARHHAGAVNDPRYPPMGARFRLKASYKIAAGLRADTKAVLLGMKRYGLVLADNGSPWYFQGTADKRWPNALLDQLKKVPASAFEAVNTLPLRVSPDSMEVKQLP